MPRSNLHNRGSLALFALLACLSACDGGDAAAGNNAANAANPVVITSTPAPQVSPSPAATTVTLTGVTTEAISASAPIRIGVQTHFSQGWSQANLSFASQVKASLLRDSLGWSEVEAVSGTYRFDSPAATKLDAACAQGFSLILTTVPQNALYDGGGLITSTEAKEKFGAYVYALASHFGACLEAVEIGNEVNGSNALTIASGNRLTNYVDIVRSAKVALIERPDVKVLGGSTNMIATGFLSKLFAAGFRDWADGVAVHPYRKRADGVGAEISHLRAVMLQTGKEVPIWVTEFSPDNTDPAINAREMVKAITLMSAAGVRNFSWYALINQKWFPNMGLFEGSSIQPTGEAFAFMQRELIVRGAPVQLQTPSGLFAFRYGSDALVVWGLRQTVSLPSGSKVFDARGRLTGETDTIQVSEEPRIILGASSVMPGTRIDLADTLQQYATGGWTYLVEASGQYSALDWMDDQFDSYLGNRWHKPLYVRPFSVAAAGSGSAPHRAVWRYVASSGTPSKATLAICVRKSLSGDGVDIRVDRNGAPLMNEVFASGQAVYRVPVNLAQGTTVDLRIGPNQTSGGDVAVVRAILSTDAATTPVCP